MRKMAVDTNVLVAMVDARDTWHQKAKNLVERVQTEQNMQLVYFDCVLNETLSVLDRFKLLTNFPCQNQGIFT